MVGDLNPARTPFVVKVADSPVQGEVLLRHPVVSRAFYTKFGLFSPSYHGVYCDNDFTTRAFWCSVILDGRSLRLDHRHPTLSAKAAPSESHDRLNRGEEYVRAEAQFRATWPRRKRNVKPRLVPTASARGLSHRGLVVTQRKLRAFSNVRYAAGLSWRAGRSLCHRIGARLPLGRH
jgi:hypothetical protein